MGDEGDGSLDAVVERLWGPLELDYVQDINRQAWTRALQRWYQLNYCLLDSKRYPDFPESLSATQLHSFRVLREWWTAQYQPAEYSLACSFIIAGKAAELHTSDIAEGNALDQTLQTLQPIYWPISDIKVEEPDESPYYNYTMHKLFDYEFNWTTAAYRTSTIRRDLLSFSREEAFTRAFCQHLSATIYKRGLESLQGFPFQTTKTMEPRPHSLFIEPCLPRLTRLAKPCDWLQIPRSRSMDDMPYYLWDRSEHRSVATKTLETVIDYTAISHTWGRWTKKKPIGVAGVPWRVPQNKRFEVRKLGAQLNHLRCGTRYVWIDLFCIPQDGSPIAAAEIARQGQIFTNAKHAVAWLNDVSAFTCLNAVLEVMMLSILYLPEGTEASELKTKCIETALNAVYHQQTGLFQRREGRLVIDELRVNPWFTSLWTLQEVCLRPDMQICASDWSYVSVLDNEPFTIEQITAVWRIFEVEFVMPGASLPGSTYNPFLWSIEDPNDDRSLLGFSELSLLLSRTKLDELHTLPRVQILSLGDKRFCKSRRAEAIMSALGVTGWYAESPSESWEVNLVLGKYPLPFLRELQHVDPVGFFGRTYKIENAYSNPEGTDVVSWRQASRRQMSSLRWARRDARPVEFAHVLDTPEGTMLPFSRYGASYYGISRSTARSVSHSSVKGWTVLADASVHIPTASILARPKPSTDSDKPPFAAHLCGFDTPHAPGIDGKPADPLEPYQQSRKIDLEAWIRSRDFEVHAVVVAHNSFGMQIGSGAGAQSVNGLIIAKLAEGPYVKLGAFIIPKTTRDIPPAVVTDWVVA